MKERDNGNLEVYLIRHGETRRAEGSGIVGAVRDFPLNDEGVRQAEALRDRLRREGYAFDGISSSPIRASRETANHVFGERNYVMDERLTKHFHGDWERRIKDDVYTEDVKMELESDPYNWHAPNGESQRDIEERMYGFLEEVRGKKPTGGIAVVTHGVPIISLLRKVLDVDSREVQGLELANTSLTRLVYDGRSWKALGINDASHLR